MLASMASNKVHIVTIIASDMSGIIILIDINLWNNEHSQICIPDYDWHIQNYEKCLCENLLNL